MKKLLSILVAAAAAFTMSTAVCADANNNDDNSGTTITFDTDVSLNYIHTFGNSSEAGLKLELTDKDTVSGKALKASENFKGSLSTRYGGIYLEAKDFGLQNFAGYTMNIYINASSKASKATSQFELFADGDEWTTVPFLTESAGTFRKASISVNADSKNDKLGISFPISNDFAGDIGIFDDIVLVDNYGNVIANIGDIDTSLYKAPNKFLSVLTTLLFIVVIAAVLGGAVLFIKKTVLKYR